MTAPAATQPLNLPAPSLWTIFFTWFMLGIQSFGGGSSTFLMIHQVTTARGWLTEEEFTRYWALAQVSPGINLLKLTVLLGHRLRGWPGVCMGLLGMLFPSGMVTVLMTAGFTVIRAQPLVQAAMRGILPATIGLSLAMSLQMGLPLVRQAYRAGKGRLSFYLLIIAAAALLLGLNLASPLGVLAITGAVMVLAGRVWTR